MRKRSAYRPRGINPTAHLVAIHGAALLSKDDRTVWALQMRGALDAVREARASKAHWDTIFDSVNLAEELVRARLASDPSRVISDAQQACADIIQRMQTTGTRAARSGELAALWDLEAAMIDILAGITHAERYRAEERIRARTRAALAGGMPGATVIDAAFLEGTT
jgi:hypothetical protein